MPLRIVTRSGWGAAAPKGQMASARYPMKELWIHHTVTRATGDPRADARQVQQIAFGRGFSDISYTFLVHPDGTVLEGRELRYVGAHTAGRNSTSLAFSLIGNYENEQPTEAQIEAVQLLRDHLKKTGHLAYGVVLPTGGHRDVYATACPGRNAYARLDDMRRQSAQPQEELSVADIQKILEKLESMPSDEHLDGVRIYLMAYMDDKINAVGIHLTHIEQQITECTKAILDAVGDKPQVKKVVTELEKALKVSRLQMADELNSRPDLPPIPKK